MKKSFIINVLVSMFLILSFSAFFSCQTNGGVAGDPGIFCEKVDKIQSDFYYGVDLSSLLSLEKSGVVFKDKEGNPQDIFKTLKDNGVNCVRLRVWNNPYDDKGNGFGGGNNDIETDIEIAKRAQAQGIKVYLDFHYSDFWADPSKQAAPRAWQKMNIEEKEKAIYEYTLDSLKKVKAAGISPVILQIGNETTGNFCGENNWIKITKLFVSASKAMREVFPKAKIAVHFTNPEKAGEYDRYAKILDRYKVDYDIFASSYYPYWHGTLENLTAELANIKNNYGKEVMCGETSYVYTYDNADMTGNTISQETVCDKPYPATVQGQADALRDVIQAVVDAGGIGVFYWEPAWIGVPGNSLEEQSALWEKYGSGWASSFAAVYDPDDAGLYYGGSSWDNQALFDFDGKPLDSLAVFKLVKKGAVTKVRPDSIELSTVKVRVKDSYSLPATVSVLFNDGSESTVPVVWNEAARTGESLSELPFMGPAVYFVDGKIEDSDLIPVLQVQVAEKNYVDNPSFEEKDISMWRITNKGNVTTELFVQEKLSDAYSGSKALHFWSSNNVDFTVEQTVSNLEAGVYKFSIALHGGDAADADMRIYAIADGKRYEMATKVDGWRNFFFPCIEGIKLEGSEIIVGAEIKCNKNAWGSLDEFLLAPVEE
ncbi:MAG: glycosyl hydrolase 53 family protein [Treponemataceae bacterium]|nr:glycosyl hydrolase 53 family protein [Treponemataceae bacterium]